MGSLKLSDLKDRFLAWFDKSSAKETLDKKNPRKKGKVVKIVTVSVVVLIVFVLMRGREVRQTTSKSTNTGPADIDLKLDTKQLEEVWFKSSNKELEEIKRRMDDFEKTNANMSTEIIKQNEGFRQEYQQKMLQLGRESNQILEELEKVRKEAESGKIAPVDADKQIRSLIRKKEQVEKESEEAVMAKQELEVKPAYPPVSMSQLGAATASNAKPTPPFLKNSEPVNTAAQGNQGKQAPGYTNLIHMDINATSALGLKGKDKEDGKAEILPLVDIIPVGSFFKCILLSGIDAATGMKAQNQPQVVLLKVTEKSQLPNKFKQDIRQCHIIGEAYGSLSEERAYIRANTLSCIKKDGSIINSEIQGYAAGEDGSLGIRGKVVSRKGAFLGKTNRCFTP